MPRIRILSLLFLFLSGLSRGSVSSDSLLTKLDAMLRNPAVYEDAKKAAVSAHLAEYATASTLQDRYNVLRSLYNEYRSYRIDSALIVADERLDIARKLGEKSKISSATLNLAEAYCRVGAVDKAIAVLDTLPMSSLEDYHLKYRISIYRTAYEQKVAAAKLDKDRLDAMDKLRYYTSEAMAASPEGSRGAFVLRAEQLRDAGLYPQAVAEMEKAGKVFDFSEDAPMQYVMGEIYFAAGEREKAAECLARSAILDISGGIKEYKALILLASILFEDGDLDRAFVYINQAFDDVDFSQANLHTIQILKSMPVIDASFHQAQKEISARTHLFLALAALLVLLLVISLIAVVREYRINRAMYATISDINSRLEDKNGALEDANKLKLQHISSLMKANAAHINNFRDFRKTLYRLLKTSQFADAIDMVKSDKAEGQAIAAFHELFDETFLSMHPDFIEELAPMMKENIRLKTPGRLAPELRVAAMMYLGINSTEEIASLLHYTPQTVYNLRSALRAMISVPWTTFENFLAGEKSPR